MIERLKTHLQNKQSDEAIAFVENHPAVLDLEDDKGSSGLMLIAYAGMEEVLNTAVTLKKHLTFHEAIVVGKAEAVQNYLDRAETEWCNSFSNDGFSPLALAAFFSKTEIAKLLLANGGDPNLAATNPSKVNALHAAVAKENYALCELFIAKGCAINAPQTQNVTALHSAVHRGNLALTKLLVMNGALLKAKMDNGDTPLMIAEREGHEAVAAYLRSALE